MSSPGLSSLDEAPACLTGTDPSDELELLRGLLDTATDLVCASTPDGRITYANQAWLRAFGYTPAEAAELRAVDMVAPEDLERYREVARRLVSGEVVEEFEAVLVAKGGRRVACRGRAVPVMADDPLLPGHRVCVGTRAAYRDVTADRRADALRAWLAKTLEATTDFVGIGTRDGHLDYLNRAGRRMVGLADDHDLSTVRPPDLHPPETLALLEREALPVIARGETWRGEGELRALDGARIPVSFVLVPHPDVDGGAPRFTAVVRDLRERKRVEAALAASEREQRTLLEASADVVVVLDGEGTYLRALPTVPDLYFEPPERLVGRRLHDVLPRAEADRFLACVRRVAAGGGRETFGYALDVPRGRVWFDAVVSSLGDGTVLWVARDATARRRAEEALQASETWHRALLDALPLGVYLAEPGPAAPALYASRGVEALGYPREAWTSTPDLWRRLLHPDDRARVVAEADTAWAEGRAKESVYRMVARDGAVRWVHDRAELVTTAGGRVVWRGILLDITVQREAERALREREGRLSLIYDSAGDLMMLLAVERDAAGAPTGYRCESVNAAFERATGIPKAHAVGRLGRELFPTAPARVREHYDAAVATGETQRYEIDIETPAGPLLVETALSPALDAAGRCTHILAASRDISERRRLEERLRQAQKMEAIGQFAGAIAHDFNNMLMVMRGNADGVLGALPPDAPAPWREALDDVVGAADRAAALTRQILAFSRRQVLQPVRVELGGAVTAVLRLLAQAVGPQVRIETRLDAAAGGVRADATQITQALLNLAVNARDAMPDGGTLTIATADRTLDRPLRHAHGEVPPGRYGALVVRDTGAGMDAATFARMFEPFFTTKPRGRGTGLGLATVHGVVEQSEGYVVAESAPGVGTTFTLYFPRLADEAPSAAPAAAPAAEGPAGRRVLLVDDEPSVRRVAQRMLEVGGYAVEAVGDGASALVALAAAAAGGALPDVVLTDVQMPGLGGRELAARVAALYPGLPVVYMSGYTTDHLVQRQVLDEAQRIVVKPFQREALLETVRGSLRT
jgi:two-component system, cell cycle sensor histidine kinase and response regulator CckA